jgi:hypothetical protein
MKTFIIIVLILCAGCAANITTPLPTKPLVRQSQSVVLPTNELDFKFTYSQSLTNGFVESSTDLVDWIRRDDYTIDPDGAWHLHDDPSQGTQFYRGGGETIQ